MLKLNLFWEVYLGLGLLFTIAELIRPARKLRYFRWNAVPWDIVACVAQQFVFFSVASRVTRLSKMLR